MFISITSFKKKKLIENKIKNYSNYNKYYIIIVDKNLQNLSQYFKLYSVIVKNYKYICHINAYNINKSNDYLNNFIGNKRIILDILSNFEKYKSLGLVFPEPNYNYLSKGLNNDVINFINNIFKCIFPKNNYKVRKKYKFSQSHMFWVKVESIYQIFNINLYKEYLKIRNREFRKIIQNIEIVYLYLVKINGYYYKKIFNLFKLL